MTEQETRESAQAAAEPPSPDGLATPSSPSVTNEPNLPPIAADADDLKAIKNAVDDAAAVGGGLWLSYLFVLFYLAVAAGAVTHADLFFENPVKLPFLNIELPLLAFFFLAPILFLIVHAYTLVHLVMLTDKAKRFDAELRDQIGDANAPVRDSLRRQLPSNIFIQFLAGPEPTNFRERAFRWLLWAIAIVTLAVAPVFLLLLFQMQFLPFHSSLIAWVQRVVLLLDLGLIWWLWSMVLSTREVDRGGGWASWVWARLGILLGLSAFLFSWTAATFPGEWQEGHLPDWRLFPARDEVGQPIKVSLHDLLFNLPVDPTTRRRKSLFASTLVLQDLNVYEGVGIDDPEKVKWRDYVFRARGRDLKGAIFDFASLPKVDFTGAQLQGASLAAAQLQGAVLAAAQLQGASLNGARLQGALLAGARLQGASLDRAQLQGAYLAFAQLQGASLDDAKLQGASLESAQLQGASLHGADLRGASLDRAQLQGASLQLASLQATDLWDAYLWRSNQSLVPTELARTARKLEDVRLSNAYETWHPLWEPLFWELDERHGPPLTYGIYQDLRNMMDFFPPFLEEESSGKIVPWDDKAYQDLRRMIDSLPSGELRNEALDRIRSVDCGNPDSALASCNSSLPLPPEASAWRKSLEDAHVDYLPYVRALAVVLKILVCSGNDGALEALRGTMARISFGSVPIVRSRLVSTGPEAPALIDYIMSKDCPVSTMLTDDDKAALLQIKQGAIQMMGQ